MSHTHRTVDRRAFVVGAGLLAADALVGASGARAQPAATLARKAVPERETDPSELQLLREAVQLLKDKDGATPASDGWIAIATPHVDHCFTEDNREIHFGWWFWPWHRAYLVAMEKRLQTVVAEPKLRLPYWDWFTVRQIPEAFVRPTYRTASGATKPNPLFDPTRAQKPEDRRLFFPPPHDASITNAVLTVNSEANLLRSTSFAVVGGQPPMLLPEVDRSKSGNVENGPHNNLHGWVGGAHAVFPGRLGGNMGQEFSPRDPVFMLHHGNIDRLWVVWKSQAVGGPRQDPTEAVWLDQTFPMPHPSGVGFEQYKVADLRDTRRFGYHYDREQIAQPIVVAEGRQLPRTFALTSRPELRSAASATEPRTVSAAEASQVRELAAKPEVSAKLVLRDVQLQSGTVVVSIYVKPDAASAPTSDDLVGFYTFLDPRGRAGRSGQGTRVEIPLPDTARQKLATQSTFAFHFEADGQQAARQRGLSVGNIDLVFE